MFLFPVILSLRLFVFVQWTHTVAYRSNYFQFLFTALRATHKLRIFWSTFFFCLPTDLLLPTFWRMIPALRKSTTRSPQWADMEQMLEHFIYIHRDFRLICCLELFNKEFDSSSTDVIFCGQAAKPDLIGFLFYNIFIFTQNLQHIRSMFDYYFEHWEKSNFSPCSWPRKGKLGSFHGNFPCGT